MSGKVYSIKSRSGPLLWLMPEPIYLRDGDNIAVSSKYVDVFERQNCSAIKLMRQSANNLKNDSNWIIYTCPIITELDTGATIEPTDCDEVKTRDVDSISDTGMHSLASNKSMADKKKKRKGKK